MGGPALDNRQALTFFICSEKLPNVLIQKTRRRLKETRVTELLLWLYDHVPYQSVWAPIVICGLLLTSVLSPAVGAFIGAWKWARKGGWIGLFAGYAWGVYGIISVISLMTRCKPEEHCAARGAWTEIFADLVRLLIGGFLATWPWQLLWIGSGVLCLYGGLAIRRRKLKAVL
jgi:hypothetical protein